VISLPLCPLSSSLLPLPTNPFCPPPPFAALAKAAGSPISFPSKRQQQPHSGGTLVNSHLPPPPCGTNATPGEPVYETRKSRGRAPRAVGRGRRMRWRTKGTRRDGVGRNAQAAEDRRTETARRFVTVTRALASSGGERVRSGVHAVHDQWSAVRLFARRDFRV